MHAMSVTSRFRQFLTALGAGYLGLAAWNGRVYRQTRRLDYPQPLEGETGIYDWPAGRIYYTRRGQREPVLLVHGIYAGADSHDYIQVFGPLSERYRVYAYDLLGFGHSDRPDVRYSGALYVRLMEDFIRDVIGRPVTVIANSLSGSHAIVAAAEAPELIRRLLLITPDGTTTQSVQPGALANGANVAFNLLPDLGEGVRNLIATRASLRWYLRNMAYYDPQKITAERIEYGYRSSHQPGAEHALIAFVTGRLNVPVDDALPRTTQPLSLFWGREARVSPLSEAAMFLALRPDARLEVFERTGLDLLSERPQEFLQRAFEVLAGREVGMAGQEALAEVAPAPAPA
jgi:pimeloyl-ACP methyl ester carboxylesterase